VPLKKKHRTGSLALSAPFCPRVFLLSVHPSERWMGGAVGIEPIAQILSLTGTLFSSAIFDTGPMDGQPTIRQVATDVEEEPQEAG
jgi:hypothetical protein